MSTIKLNGTTSGSSIIKAPDSGSTNQTFTLPASSGTLVTTTDAGVAGITSSADATAMTITSDEKIGIGTTSPSASLHIQQTSDGSGLSGQEINTAYFQNQEATSGHNYGVRVKAGSNSTDYAFRVDTVATNSVFEVKGDGRGLSQFTAKAWIRVNQTGTQSISDSHNISSISDGGVGKTTAFFANSMANTNYAVTFGADFLSWGSIVFSDNFATGSFLLASSNGSGYEDQRFVHGVVYGD